MTGILIGCQHVVDAGSFVEEEAFSTIRLRHWYWEISPVSLILEDCAIICTIVEAYLAVLDRQHVVLARLVFRCYPSRLFGATQHVLPCNAFL